ncbi:MAG: ATP-binding protein, partial [Puniceicoccales bacterium]
ISVDRVLMVQVLLNLLINGMDAVSGVPMSQRVVSLGCDVSQEEGWVDLIVCDGGTGVSPGRFDSIFEFFYSTKEDGMGLGLAISRFIIQDHRGQLTVENRDEGGACFRVRLFTQ